MTEPFQPVLTPQVIDQLQHLRVSVLAFQNMIAVLPADEQNNARNEQFNQLRLEVKALLKDAHFDKKVARVITEDGQADRQHRIILPRLSGIVIFGVMLALLGLGVNSIILDELIINSLACLVSSGGMLLIVAAFVVWMLIGRRRRLSNLGEVYLGCNALLYEINHALGRVIPNLAEGSSTELPETPSVVALMLDSLNKQAADWQQKLGDLEEKRLSLGPEASLELKINTDFVQRELQRVKQEIDRLRGREEPVPPTATLDARVIIPPGVASFETEEKKVDSNSVRRAKSVTMEMPASHLEEPAD